MKKLIYCLIGIMACGSVMGQSASSPESWQFGTASTRDIYYGGRCDTVITRTCGHSVTVTAARMIDEQNHVLNHRFFVRCMNGQNYFRFDILPSEHSIMPTYTVDRRYHIHDMRISDSICFFCGTQVTRMRFLADSLVPASISLDTVITTGFFGRFDIDELRQRLNGAKWPFQVEFTLVPQTSALENMRVGNGIFEEGGSGSDIAGAHGYLFGRMYKDPQKPCMAEVTQGLRNDGYTDTWFKLCELDPQAAAGTAADAKMVCVDNFTANWTDIRPLVTKHDVDNNCTK